MYATVRLWSESEMEWIENEVKRGNLKVKGGQVSTVA